VNTEQWLPLEGDLHLRIWLAGMGLDYIATAEAVRNLVHDWERKCWCTIELMQEAIEDCRLLPRLPCERLFLGP
jgi:hypothetical protein